MFKEFHFWIWDIQREETSLDMMLLVKPYFVKSSFTHRV
jgi:hypothetical protein